MASYLELAAQGMFVLLAIVIIIIIAVVAWVVYFTWWPPFRGGKLDGYYFIFGRTGPSTHVTMGGHFWDVTHYFLTPSHETQLKRICWNFYASRIRMLKQIGTPDAEAELKIIVPWLRALHQNMDRSYDHFLRVIVTRSSFTRHVHIIFQYGNLGRLSKYASTNPYVESEFVPAVPGFWTAEVVEGFWADVQEEQARTFQRVSDVDLRKASIHFFCPISGAMRIKGVPGAPPASVGEAVLANPQLIRLVGSEKTFTRVMQEGQRAIQRFAASNIANTIQRSVLSQSITDLELAPGLKIRAPETRMLPFILTGVCAIIGAIGGAYWAGAVGAAVCAGFGAMIGIMYALMQRGGA